MVLDPGLTLNVVSVLLVTGSLVFAGLQVREANKQRRHTATLQALESLRSAEHTRYQNILRALPDGLGVDEVARLTPEQRDAWYFIGRYEEALGIMVYHRIVDFYVLEKAIGGIPQGNFAKQRRFHDEMRAQLGPAFGEWREWLCHQLDEAGKRHPGRPAVELHAGWRP